MSGVEILVAQESREQARSSLGELRGAAVRSAPSASSSVRRLVVAYVEDLSSEQRLRQIGHLLESASKYAERPTLVFTFAWNGPFEPEKMKPLVQALAGATYICRSLFRKSAPEAYVTPDADALRRLALARIRGAEKELIASASLAGRDLEVWSCEPRKYLVPADALPALASMDDASLRHFSVSRSGSRIHWELGDVDIDLNTIREAVDPEFRRANEVLAREDAARYGKAIKQLREEARLTQKEIPGLSERQVRRLELGGTTPRADTLRKLAAAHGMEPSDYLNKLALVASTKATRRAGRSRSRARAIDKG